MDNEIYEQYEKVKDKLSEEEFQSKMDELRSDFDNVDYDDLDLAKQVVDSYFVVDDISSDESEMDDALLEKYELVKDKVSKEDFLSRINEIKIKEKDNPFISEEGIVEQVVAEFGVTQENVALTERDEYSASNIGLLEDGDKEQSFTGRVMSISNPRSFTTRKNKAGKVCNVDVEDKTGKTLNTLGISQKEILLELKV